MSRGHRNYNAGVEFRRRVTLFLHESGHNQARMNNPTKLSEALATCGDISGFPEWAIKVRNEVTHDFSALLNEARREASLHQRAFHVGVMARRNYPVEESYAVMPLHQVAEILHLLAAHEDDEPAA